MEQRRLADARGADDGQHLAPFDRQVELSEDLNGNGSAAVGLGQTVRFEKGHARRIMNQLRSASAAMAAKAPASRTSSGTESAGMVVPLGTGSE